MLTISSICNSDQKAISAYALQRRNILVAEFAIHPKLVEETSIHDWKDVIYLVATDKDTNQILGGVVICFSMNNELPIHSQLNDKTEILSDALTRFEMCGTAQLCGIFVSKSNTDCKLAEKLCLQAIEIAQSRKFKSVIVLCNKFGERTLQKLNFHKLNDFGEKGYINYPSAEWESYMYAKKIV